MPNIVGVMAFNTFNKLTVQQQIRDNLLHNYRMRSTVSKVFGTYYWNIHNLKSKKLDCLLEGVFNSLDYITSEEELCNFLCNEAKVAFRNDELQYKFFFVENYSDTESLLVIKA